MSTAYLTTGWEPDLSDDDSICLRWLRHWSAQLAAFAEAAGGPVVHDERYLLADHGRPASYLNAAVLLTPWSDDAAFGAVVDEIEARTEGYPMDDLQPFRPGTLAAPALLDDPRFWTSSEGGTPVTASASPCRARGAASHSKVTPSSSALATSRSEPGMLALSRR